LSKTLIVGDIHIGKGISIGKNQAGNGFNSRIVDQMRLLDWILDQANFYEVDRLILTGDIFEEARPEFYLLQIFIDWLKKLELECIDVHIISGNHDIKRSGNQVSSVLDMISSYDFQHIFYHKSITTINTTGASFTFLPYRDRRGMNVESNNDALKEIEERLSYELLDIPYEDSRVLIGHLALEKSIYVGDEIDDYMNELICPLSMFVGYHYTWMGHVHRPQIMNSNPHIAHIGSLDLSDYGETDHTKILILFDPESDDKYKEIPVPSRPLRRFKVNIPENVDSTEYVIEAINVHNETLSYKNALVKLEISIAGEQPGVNKKLIEECVYGLGAYYISNISESRNISVVSAEKRELVDNTVDPKSAVKLYASTQTFKDDEEKSLFIQICNEIIEEQKETVK
jgi:exonuclease SbcD